VSRRYLFEFRPLDSFSFSGETSARTHGVDDTFAAKAANASRRQSFRVDSDLMPPQTTVMGAVRRMLFGKYDIGLSTFDLSKKETQDMGVIRSLSAIFLLGQNEKNEQVACVPAPGGLKINQVYQPVTPALYKAKEGIQHGFLCYDRACLTGTPVWHEEGEFFKTYEQAVVHIGSDARTDSFHLQRKCRLVSNTLTDLRFCVIADLEDSVQTIQEPLLLSLGSRDSRFQCSMRETALDFSEITAGEYQADKNWWCVSLLSATCLPEDWRNTDGLVQAFVDRRDMRCAISNKSKGYAMQLISEKLVLADKGSVFLFDSETARDDFAARLRSDKRSVCGLNQVLCYGFKAAL